MKKDKAMKLPQLKLEGEAGLSACFEDVYPDATVKISRDQYSVFEIRRMIRDTGELILDPEFQRKHLSN
jgi:hypothetical protein